MFTILEHEVQVEVPQRNEMFSLHFTELGFNSKNEEYNPKYKTPNSRYLKNLIVKKTNFMAPFYGWGSTATRLEPLQGGSLLFTIQFPEIPDTHFINLRRIKG